VRHVLTLYLQDVLGYSALETRAAFLVPDWTATTVHTPPIRPVAAITHSVLGERTAHMDTRLPAKPIDFRAELVGATSPRVRACDQ
jgi:hypothetical protein